MKTYRNEPNFGRIHLRAGLLSAKTGLFSPQSSLMFFWPGTSHVNSPQVPEGRGGGRQSRGQPYSSPLNHPPSRPLPTWFSWITWMTIACHSHTHKHSRQSADCEATHTSTVARSQQSFKVGDKQINIWPLVDLEPFFISQYSFAPKAFNICSFFTTMQSSLSQFNLGNW